MAVNHETKLIENVTNLMACDSFNDVRIRLSNGVQVVANKVILSAMSSFFKNRLDVKQKNTNGDDRFLEVDLDISSTKEMLKLVIKYFYTGKMNFDSLPLKDLLDLLNLLLFLDLDVLSTLVEEFIIDKIKKGGFQLEKLLILSSTAEAFYFEDIVSTMLAFLSLNINDVSKLPEVKYMSFEFLKNLIIVDEAEVVPNSIFFARYETVGSWIASNDVIEDVRMQLISMFDLKNFTARQLTTTVRESKLFSESSILDVLSNTVIQLQEKNEELSEDVISGRHSNTDLNKKIDELKETIKSKEKSNNELNKNIDKLKETIKSQEKEVNEANAIAKKANDKANAAAKDYKFERNVKYHSIQVYPVPVPGDFR